MNQNKQTTLFTGISQLVQPHLHSGTHDDPIDIIDNAAMLVKNGIIVHAGTAASVQEATRNASSLNHVDLGGKAVVPGLIDAHTHVCHAGSRMDDMAERARGTSYEQISQRGGGILSSVKMLQDSSPEDIYKQSSARLDAMLRRGTTTVEIKSGYGLEPELEIKHLRAIQALRETHPISIYATVLAHGVPPAYHDKRQLFIDIFCKQVLDVAKSKNLANYCDIFIERTAYSIDEAEHIAAHAQKIGLPLKLHVEQLGHGGGAALASRWLALSADHLEYANEADFTQLAKGNVVSTILPGCCLFLGNGPWPDARKMRAAGCQVAIATDCNPGSSMIVDLALCGTVAATQCGLTLEEALWGITRGGAMALGLTDRGCLREGERADFVVLNHQDWRALLYYVGHAPIDGVYLQGHVFG